MKILQVNCVYNTGSTGRIMMSIHRSVLQAGNESVQCYGRGKRVCVPGVYKTCPEVYAKANNLLSRITGLMYGGCFFSTRKLISVIKKERPDVVHLHCINGYFVNIYDLVAWLKKERIKTVLTLHAEFMHTANCAHALECEKWKSGCGACPRRKQETKSLLLDGTARSWKKMKQAFDGFEDLTAVSVSEWLMNRAKQSPVLSSARHLTIHNGVKTDVFHVAASDGRLELKKRFGVGDKKLILHVTASFSQDPNHFKGGWFVLELARRMPDVVFAVVGNQERCVDLPSNIIDVGRVEDEEHLAEWYSAADATVLTSKKETFSMVTAESLCCGTPVVGFKAGGPECIALPSYSRFVDYGDIEALERNLRETIAAQYDREKIAEQAMGRYSTETMCSKYLSVYTEKKF